MSVKTGVVMQQLADKTFKSGLSIRKTNRFEVFRVKEEKFDHFSLLVFAAGNDFSPNDSILTSHIIFPVNIGENRKAYFVPKDAAISYDS